MNTIGDTKYKFLCSSECEKKLKYLISLLSKQYHVWKNHWQNTCWLLRHLLKIYGDLRIFFSFHPIGTLPWFSINEAHLMAIVIKTWPSWQYPTLTNDSTMILWWRTHSKIEGEDESQSLKLLASCLRKHASPTTTTGTRSSQFWQCTNMSKKSARFLRPYLQAHDEKLCSEYKTRSRVGDGHLESPSLGGLHQGPACKGAREKGAYYTETSEQSH